MNKDKIIDDIKNKYPFLIQNIESQSSIEEMLNMIETQSFPEDSDFQGFFVAYFSDSGYKIVHNSKIIKINHLKIFESTIDEILKKINEYNIVNDLLHVEIEDAYLIFKVYFDKNIKDKILAIGHILKRNISTRLMILDQKQLNKLIKG